MKSLRLELNLTLACNHACPACNRLCDRFPKRTGHMSLEQVDKLCEQVQDAQTEGRASVKRLKVVGGEPLLHPDYPEVHARLCAAADAGIFQSVKIQSNGILPKPKGLATSPRVRFSGMAFGKRGHLPIWSPEDHGQVWQEGCMMIGRCGASLDAWGWLPCSAAIAIVAVFELEHLYREELPTEPWGLNELCQHCACAGPKEWQDEHTKLFKDMWPGHRQPSSSWVEAMLRKGADWDGLPKKDGW